jgi:protein phosphatase
MSFQLETSFQTNTGLCRSHNEDAIQSFSLSNGSSPQDGLLVVLSDGMGGHQSGEIASNMAIDIIGKTFLKQYDNTNPSQLLKNCIIEANQTIFDAAEQKTELNGMGATCTALFIDNEQGCFAHVGDSRLYCLRNNQLSQLTEDHTMVSRMVKDGLISASEARNHPNRHLITRALGTKPEIQVDLSDMFPIQSGDIFLLCSDGLHDLVSDKEIQQALTQYLPYSAASYLIDLANQYGGYDNISVGIIAIQPVTTETKSVPITRESRI